MEQYKKWHQQGEQQYKEADVDRRFKIDEVGFLLTDDPGERDCIWRHLAGGKNILQGSICFFNTQFWLFHRIILFLPDIFSSALKQYGDGV